MYIGYEITRMCDIFYLIFYICYVGMIHLLLLSLSDI